MLPRKPLTASTQAAKSKPETKKPYSLLSLGLQKLPGGLINHRAYGKFDAQNLTNQAVMHHRHRNQISHNVYQNQSNTHKIKIERQLNKNNVNQNLDRTLQGISQSCKHQKNSSKLQIFNDQIVFAAPLLKLDNITNQMIEEDSQIKRKIDYKPHFILQNEKYAQEQVYGDSNQEQNCKIFIDMKKKIKKLSKSKRFLTKCIQKVQQTHIHQLFSPLQISRNQIITKHNNFLRNPYPDSDVIVEASIYRNKLINQRIDNDIDTDDQQVAAGIRRLQKSLFDAAKQNQIWQRQKQRIINSQQWSNEQNRNNSPSVKRIQIQMNENDYIK